MKFDFSHIRPRGAAMSKTPAQLLQEAVNASVVGVKRGSELFCLDCRPDEKPKYHMNYAALADGCRCRACARVYADGEWT